MGCRPCIQLESPQSILDDDEIDVFEEIIPNTEYEYNAKREALWAMYRHRGIPSCDRDYWIQCMKDRYAITKETWDLKIKTWRQYLTSTASDVDLSVSSSDYTLTNEFEDMPSNPAGDTKYLSTRNTATYAGKNHADLESATVRDYTEAVPDFWIGFARVFERYFWIGV